MSDRNSVLGNRASRASRRDEASSERHEATESDRLNRNRIRLREIESKDGIGTKGRVLTRKSDRIAAARAVGSLVRDAKAKNVTVEQIKANLQNTNRLDRYMLAPDIKPADVDKKSKKLQQRVHGYLSAAHAIATLTHQDPDLLKIQVLSGTSLWSQPSVAQVEDDPRASHLALELIEMGRSVARRSNLRTLFARARRIRGVWDPTVRHFNPSTMACLFQQAYLNWFEHWTEAPPLPSVPLVRYLHSTSQTTVRLETLGRAEPLTDNSSQDESFIGTKKRARVEMWREVRIALGPIASEDDIGPMFESRALVAICFDDQTLEPQALRPSHAWEAAWDSSWVAQVQIDGLWHRVALAGGVEPADHKVARTGDDPFMWAPNPLDPADSPIEHGYFSWMAINAHSVGYWLDRRSGSDTVSVVAPYGNKKDAITVWYATSSVAQEVEYALASTGIESALDAEVKHLSDMLDQRDARWRAEAAQVHEDRMLSWQDANKEEA